MCSTGDDGLRDMIPDQSGHLEGIRETVGKCNKCDCDLMCAYKLKFREPECRDCFLAYVCHKFRAALGSSKILPRDAKVLMVYDGSAEATTLLDMLYSAQTQSTFKRLHCSADILYIDDTAIALRGEEAHGQHREHMQQVTDFLSLYPQMQSYVVPLQHSSDSLPLHDLKTLNEYHDGTQNTADNNLMKYLAEMQSLTARQDYIRQLKQRLVVAVAMQLQCKFVFLSDISTTVATQLLTAVALGRGGSAALDVALVDDRFAAKTGVKLIRPIRDLTQSEVQLYLHAKQLESLKTYASHMDCMSIYNLTNTFVNGLQNNYNSTVSTVFRTGNKITSNVELNNTNQEDRCVFCEAPLVATDSSTLLAIEFSRIVSSTGAALNTDNVVSMAKTKSHHKNGLCHACANIQNATTNKDLF